MAGPFKVRLEDGMEVGPLDGEMLRSWYQQGLITREAKIRAKGSKQWVRLVDTFDISDWGAAGGSGRGKPGPEDLAGIEADDEGFEDAGPQTWRTYFACALFFLLAAGSGYFSLFPALWRMPPDTPWREIALGFVVLGLLLVRGWEPMRKLVRVLVLILTLALFPLAEVLIFRGVPWRSLVVLFPAVVMGFGLFFFLSGRYKPWTRVVLNLFWIAGRRGRRGAPRRFPAAGGRGLDGGAVAAARRAARRRCCRSPTQPAAPPVSDACPAPAATAGALRRSRRRRRAARRSVRRRRHPGGAAALAAPRPRSSAHAPSLRPRTRSGGPTSWPATAWPRSPPRSAGSSAS